jgi:hypothetical protein
MAENDNNKNQGTRTQIIVALIGLVGVIATALFGNWDKIFRTSQLQPGTTSSPSVPSPLITPSSPFSSQQKFKGYITTLKDLLAAKNFREADKETRKIMLQLSNREREGWIDRSSIEKISCGDIRTIDQLWRQYSNNKFGFSIQKRIYQSVGNTEKFGELVGWRKNGNWLTTNDLKYDLESPIGHFPSTSREGNLSGGWLVWFLLSDSFSSAASCISSANI